MGLTDTQIRNLALPEGGQVTIWDKTVPGLGLRVTPKGTKTFSLLYRIDGRMRRATLGRYPIVKLAEARERARGYLNQVSSGVDPLADHLTNGVAIEPLTFATAVEKYIERYARPHTKSWAETKRLLEREFVSHWRDVPMSAIAKQHVIEVIEQIVDRGSPSAARHAFAAIRGFFNWAMKSGYIDSTPCGTLAAPGKHRSRDRVLTDAELARIIRAALETPFPFGSLVQLLILTAQRRSEVASMRWADLDFSDRLWTIPGQLNKSGRDHIVPLTDAVLQIVQGLPQTASAFVFPANGNPRNHFSGYSKAKRQLDRRCSVTGWTLHDLRRTAATGMARAGVAPHVIERVLNHREGIIHGVASIYNRFGYLPEMKDALSIWEGRIMALSASPRQGAQFAKFDAELPLRPWSTSVAPVSRMQEGEVN